MTHGSFILLTRRKVPRTLLRFNGMVKYLNLFNQSSTGRDAPPTKIRFLPAMPEPTPDFTIKSAKTKAEAEEQEDLIVAKIRHGEFDLLKDKTKFADFVDETYLPYCQLNNANYKQKIYETNSLKRFFKNILLKAVSPSLCENYKKWRLEQKSVVKNVSAALTRKTKSARRPFQIQL